MGYPFENIGIGQENQKQNRYRIGISGGRIGIGEENREAESGIKSAVPILSKILNRYPLSKLKPFGLSKTHLDTA